MRAFDIHEVRKDFPILAREVYGKPLVYLDNAATAQKPRRVLGAMDAVYLDANANIHRGVHRLADETTLRYEAARESVRRFIGAEHAEEIVFTSGATASLNLAAQSLCRLLVGEGDNVIVSEMEHHSNIVPWQMAARGTTFTGRGLHVGFDGAQGSSAGAASFDGSSEGTAMPRGSEIRVLPTTDEGLLDLEALENLIDERTRIIAVTQCSNVLGTRPDIARIVDIAHRRGIIVVVDGCQGVVHGSINVRETGCDFYAFSAHKLYGPTGIGVLYGKKELFERIPPPFGGGDMIEKVSFSETTFAALPFKFEAGTSNYVGAVGLAEAINYLGEFDPREIERHENELLRAATEELTKIDGLRIYGKAQGKAPIISFTVEGTHASDVGAILDKQGIAVRTGTHCAQPLAARYGVSSLCRASLAMYNTMEEVDALAAGVRKAVKMLRR